MKYSREKSNDWVIFKPGVACLTISQVVECSNKADGLVGQIESCHFENDAGKFDNLASGAELYDSLTFQQFDWLGSRLIAWARDEALDPEA
jgi:hypothetical protein